jgi:hypothetical protein
LVTLLMMMMAVPDPKKNKRTTSSRVDNKSKKSTNEDSDDEEVDCEDEDGEDEGDDESELPYDMKTSKDLFGTGDNRNKPYSEQASPIAKKKFRQYIRDTCKPFDMTKNIKDMDVKIIKDAFELFNAHTEWGKLNANFPNDWTYSCFVDIIKTTHDK